LIQQGALLVTQGEEIAKDLGWDDFPKTETVSNQLSFKLDNHTILKEGSFEGSVEERLVLSQISYDPMNIESLIEQTGLTSETLMMALTMLELADQIKTLPGHQVCRL
jgi:predicted Rossmann fold nucleotide-binding protein DprA/Smf involved in DNA uptake